VRDDITSFPLTADTPYSPGKDETGDPGEDRDVERKNLKCHRYHEQDTHGGQHNRCRSYLVVRQFLYPPGELSTDLIRERVFN
jgi:hypothetical protein